MMTILANVVLDKSSQCFLPQIGRVFGALGSAIGIILSPDLYYYSLFASGWRSSKALGGSPEK